MTPDNIVLAIFAVSVAKALGADPRAVVIAVLMVLLPRIYPFFN